MGLSSALGQRHAADEFEPNAATEFLRELETQLPRIRNDLLTEAKSPSLEKRATRAKRLDELAGRVRELAARAVSFDHAVVAEELGVCEAVLSGAGVLGSFDLADAEQLEESLDRVAAYVVSERERERTPTSGPVGPVFESALSSADLLPPAGPTKRGLDAAWALAVPPTVLVVAPPSLAHSLEAASIPAPEADESSSSGQLEVESVDEAPRAPELARALAPDVIVVDVDLAGARQLIEALVDGPLTAAIPIIAVGDWDDTEQAAPFVALGAARTLAKPASSGTLRRACLELAANPANPTFEPIGETTLDRLGQRLAEELRHGLCDAADDETRSLAIDVGQGTEVHAALWGAIARIRELVAARSEGRVRFVPTGPEGALPAASWLTSGKLRLAGDRAPAMHEVRRAAPQHALAGRTVLIAESDLSVNWFLAGVLRQAGATVHEARDGVTALGHAYRSAPDLVISDILLPELDGFSLCRALKRDVILRDVPVILLAWKEDLLQRVRELGVGAEGYLRKEASSGAIVRRVSEVLRARSEVATRIETAGAVRGRLDGLTAHSLLQLVCRLRPDSRLSVRDAMFLYEIDVRAGRPVSATRTTSEGGCTRGPDVIAALLGVGIGRFGLADATDPVTPDLEGSLEEQLVAPVARARASQGLLSGPALLEVERVSIDEEYLEAYGDATPEALRRLLQAIDGGSCPRELIDAGLASTSMIENVLGDAIRYGAVRSVRIDGVDVLEVASEREQRLLEGAADEDVARGSLEALVRAAGHFDGSRQMPTTEAADHEEPEPSAVPLATVVLAEAHRASDEQREPVGGPRDPEDAEAAGGSRTPILASGMAVVPVVNPQPRFGDRPAEPATAAKPAEPAGTDAAEREKEAKPTEALDPVGAAPAVGDAAPLVSAPQTATALEAPSSLPEPAPSVPEVPVARPPRVPMPSAYAPESRLSREKRPRNRFLWPIVFGVVGIALALGARWMREHRSAPEPAAPTPPAQQAAVPAQTPIAAAPNAQPSAPSEASTPSRSDAPQELPLTKDDAVGPGEGMLEVVAGKSDKIYVNGKLIGQGPVQKVTLKAVPDPYEVRVKMLGEERVRYAVVKEGKRIKLRVAPPWKR